MYPTQKFEPRTIQEHHFLELKNLISLEKHLYNSLIENFDTGFIITSKKSMKQEQKIELNLNSLEVIITHFTHALKL